MLILKRTRKYKVKIISKRNCVSIEAFWIAWNETMSSYIFGVSGWNDFHSWVIIFLCYYSMISVTFEQLSKVRRHEMTPWRHSRGKRSPFSALRTMLSRWKLAESVPFLRRLHFCHSSFLLPILFPFSICLDLSLSVRTGTFVACQSTICKILADLQKFVGFTFICKTYI